LVNFKKNKSQTRKHEQIAAHDFLEYVRTLYGDLPASTADEPSNESSSDIFVDELDAEINIGKVTHAINSLKSGKSSGSDGLIGKILSSCADILSPIIVKLFNVIFETGTYPQKWTNGIITPISKKKNPK
jgi:hypothetical protein